jgi:uncharacterized protein with GYD domain
VEELGAKVLHQWATLGDVDFVNIVEAPDAATIARVSVALGARGSTKVRTLPALIVGGTRDCFSRQTAPPDTPLAGRGAVIHTPPLA